MRIVRITAVAALLTTALYTGVTATATAQAQPFQVRVVAWPGAVQVGHQVQISVRANQAWPHGSSATVILASPHHGITIAAPWRGGCSCFRVLIYLIPRVHPPEQAQVGVYVTVRGRQYQAGTTFEIYGLLPSGQPEPLPAGSGGPSKTPTTSTALLMHAWVWPDPSTVDDYPTLWVETLPGATCAAKVTYSNGRAPALFSSAPEETDGNGLTGWTWYIDQTATASGTAAVTCARESLHGTTSVVFHVASH